MKALQKSLLSIALVALSLSLTSCTTYGRYDNADKYLVGDQTYSATVKELDVDWTSGELTLIEDKTTETITIKEESNEELIDAMKVHSYVDGDVLRIKYWESGYTYKGFVAPNKHLYVTFPGFEKLSISLTSGELESNDIEANKINISMTSGEMNLGKITCSEFNFSMTSGKAIVDYLDADIINCSLTSGRIIVKGSRSSNMSFSITSGTVDLTIPEEGAEISFKKTSGSYQSERKDYLIDPNNNKYLYGEGTCQIKIKITSGKAIIR